MADDGSAPSTTIWPLPDFRFRVTIGDKFGGAFEEVTGLNTEAQVIEYRHGNSQLFSTQKMPGIAKTGNVTLKRGRLASDSPFWDWYGSAEQNTIKRETVLIELLDESDSLTMTWTLTNAWPTKVSGADMKSDGDEIAVHTIEFAFETLTVGNG